VKGSYPGGEFSEGLKYINDQLADDVFELSFELDPIMPNLSAIMACPRCGEVLARCECSEASS